MDLLVSLAILVAICVFCFLVHGHMTWIRRNKLSKNETVAVPEAAGSWPIIGHLHLLAGSQPAHKVLGSMADKFGPIFTIRLGVHRFLVISNSEMAKECLTTNDRVFASRPQSMGGELMNYNYANFGLSPYGPYWREMRKIIVLELVSHRRLQMLEHVRVSQVKSSVTDLYTSWINKKKGFSEKVLIDMNEWFGKLVMNMVVTMTFGDRFSPGEQNNDRIKESIRRSVELTGAFVPSDAIPWLRWLDLGGYAKKMNQTAKEIDVIFERWLDEHRKKKDESKEDQVFMAALLSRVNGELKEDLSGFNIHTVVKATCLAIFVAATDTTTLTLTWALSLLVNNPVVLQKGQQELAKHVGRDRNVQESDLKNLVYLQAIIKETLRLYPAAPLLVPHESTEDCVVGGYLVPKETRLFVNVWKIQHDPQIWTDPFEFQPERFLTTKKDIDVKGQHFELIPFGSGRRMCPGISLALETLQLILANILHGFEFYNPSDEPIDMTESPGITNVKATPLELLVAPRLVPHLYGLSA